MRTRDASPACLPTPSPQAHGGFPLLPAQVFATLVMPLNPDCPQSLLPILCNCPSGT